MSYKNIVDKNDEDATESSSDPSGTFIEFSEVEHPDAYQVISNGDDKRPNGNAESIRQDIGSDVHDLFAPVAVLVADMIYKGETAAYMAWAEPDAEDIVDLIVSGATDVTFKGVQDEVRERYGDDETDTDE
jgi:hypothetical protein